MPEAPSNPELDRLLVEIHVRLRQEQYGEVKERLDKAKALAPDHPAVLEAEGDLAFAQGRYKQAETLFKAALQADPGNARVEEKFATALLKVQMPGFSVNQIPEDADSLWSNRVPRPSWASGLLSLFIPGLGQFYNGDFIKGGILVLVDIIFWRFVLGHAAAINAAIRLRMGIPKENPVPYDVFFHDFLRSFSLPMLLLLAATIIYGVADAIIVAQQTRASSPEWK